MNDPRISVVVPNYNHAKYLSRCLGALLSQPVLPFEIIVVDDASTDNSIEVAKKFAQDHPIIRVVRNETNMGVMRTAGRGLDLACGDYVAFVASDNEVKPGIFEHAARLLRAYPMAGLCTGLCEFQDPSSGIKWYLGGNMPSEPCYLTPAEMAGLVRKRRLTVICTYGAIFKKSALVEAGGWIPELRWSSDWFGTSVIAFRHGMCHVPEVLSISYVYSDSYSHAPGRAAAERKVVREVLRLLESDKYADVGPVLRKAGVLGAFGWPILRVIVFRPKHWRLVNFPFVLEVAQRCAEHLGRRFLPKWLARFCVRVFYGKR